MMILIKKIKIDLTWLDTFITIPLYLHNSVSLPRVLQLVTDSQEHLQAYLVFHKTEKGIYMQS